MEVNVTPIQQLHRLGQSVWYDNIERRLLENGYLERMISERIIRGVTSNPSIFNNAISNSTDYDRDLEYLAKTGKNAMEIYETLAIADIKGACDRFQPLYETTKGKDGYVSLEVNPYLANEFKETVADAKRLWKMVDRPNLMVKIPATVEGLAAISESIFEGININVTLIFSIERYKQVIESYLTGLEKRLDHGMPINRIASVASFFVSRIDTNVDKQVSDLLASGKITITQANKVWGKIAIANAKFAYSVFKESFNSERFQHIQSKGGHIQRPLWASTSTKNPVYPDTIYVDELIGPDTVNTIPPHTLEAFLDHGKAELTLETDISSASEVMVTLSEIGISIKDVTDKLEIQGVKSFTDSFTSLLNSIENRRNATKQFH